jgi:N utilization substance protein A
VVVSDKQLSLAIGREGQNARLAARLTVWRIDIKSASMAEAEQPAEVKVIAGAEEKAVVSEPPLTTEVLPAELIPEVPPVVEPELVSTGVIEEPAPSVPFEMPVTVETPGIRFAEDILAPGAVKPGAKSKKKKKGVRTKEDVEGGVRPRKQRLAIEDIEEEEEAY